MSEGDRAAVIEVLMAYCGNRPPALGPLEFTRKDWKRMLHELGRARSMETAKQ